LLPFLFSLLKFQEKKLSGKEKPFLPSLYSLFKDPLSQKTKEKKQKERKKMFNRPSKNSFSIFYLNI